MRVERNLQWTKFLWTTFISSSYASTSSLDIIFYAVEIHIYMQRKGKINKQVVEIYVIKEEFVSFSSCCSTLLLLILACSWIVLLLMNWSFRCFVNSVGLTLKFINHKFIYFFIDAIKSNLKWIEKWDGGAEKFWTKFSTT